MVSAAVRRRKKKKKKRMNYYWFIGHHIIISDTHHSCSQHHHHIPRFVIKRVEEGSSSIDRLLKITKIPIYTTTIGNVFYDEFFGMYYVVSYGIRF